MNTNFRGVMAMVTRITLFLVHPVYLIYLNIYLISNISRYIYLNKYKAYINISNIFINSYVVKIILNFTLLYFTYSENLTSISQFLPLPTVYSMDGGSILKIVAPSPPTLREQRIQTMLHNVELLTKLIRK